MGIFPEDAQQMTDEQLLKVLASSDTGSHAYVACDDEWKRRHVTSKAHESRKSLRLGWALFWLTVVLVLLAIPPAWRALVE